MAFHEGWSNMTFERASASKHEETTEHALTWRSTKHSSKVEISPWNTTTTYAKLDLPKDKHASGSTKATIIIHVLHHLVLCAPVLALFRWLVPAMRGSGPSLLGSAVIGGNYTQLQAKTIDLIAGVFIAPIIMFIMNLVFFRISRTVLTVKRLEEQKPIPLVALMEASVTSAGTWDAFKIWRILRAWDRRFLAMAVLVILSALSTSLFVNVIAYEAKDTWDGDISYATADGTLDALSDPALISPNSTGYNLADSLTQKGRLFNFTDAEEQQLSISYMGLLNQIYYATYNARDGFGLTRSIGPISGQEFSQYTGEETQIRAINVTRESVGTLHENVDEIYNVKGYQQRLSCEPAKIKALDFNIVSGGYINYTAWVSVPSEQSQEIVFESTIRGEIASMNSDNLTNVSSRFSTLLWDTKYGNGGSKVLLLSGRNQRWPMDQPLPTKEHFWHDFNATGSWKDPRSFSIFRFKQITQESESNRTGELWNALGVFSIACEFKRQPGLLNLTNDKYFSPRHYPGWEIFGSQFEAPEEPVYSLLHSVQTAYEYRPPRRTEEVEMANGTTRTMKATTVEGAGSAIGVSLYLENFVTNLLFASVSLEQTIYNLRLGGKNYREDYTSVSVPITLRRKVTAYRIVYIPGLLVGGLVCLTLASAIVFAMQLRSWDSIPRQQHRVVDGVRFVTDFAAAMREEDNVAEIPLWNASRLDDWASKTRFRYLAVGGKSVRLHRVGEETKS